MSLPVSLDESCLMDWRRWPILLPWQRSGQGLRATSCEWGWRNWGRGDRTSGNGRGRGPCGRSTHWTGRHTRPLPSCQPGSPRSTRMRTQMA